MKVFLRWILSALMLILSAESFAQSDSTNVDSLQNSDVFSMSIEDLMYV